VIGRSFIADIAKNQMKVYMFSLSYISKVKPMGFGNRSMYVPECYAIKPLGEQTMSTEHFATEALVLYKDASLLTGIPLQMCFPRERSKPQQ